MRIHTKKSKGKCTTYSETGVTQPNLSNKPRLKVPFSNRADTIITKDKQPPKQETLNYTPYIQTTDIRKILKPTPIEAGKIQKPRLAFKIKKSLANILVKAKLKDLEQVPISETPITIEATPSLKGHSAGCDTPNCKCCGVMSKKLRIISSHNGRNFPTPPHTNCSTSNVIYLIECSKCESGNQYIGQTTRQLRTRWTEHKAASKVKTHLPTLQTFHTN